MNKTVVIYIGGAEEANAFTIGNTYHTDGNIYIPAGKGETEFYLIDKTDHGDGNYFGVDSFLTLAEYREQQIDKALL